ncbi:hypothetical protein JXO59_06915, partial [candidate division KSB1 bacterium]|nr:hypothetical protein [candidate division KSB1 bacterium]
MFSLSNIWSVALYEMKTLFRSWFFRILALLAFLILGFFDVLFYSGVEKSVPWIFRGLSSFIPYQNIVLLNIVQAILAVFLASDFIKRDKKMDTTEVIYMRSMSNGDYVLGKLFGILMVFLGLNAFMLLFVGVINGVFADVPVHWFSYLFYPLAISIPSLFFIFGLAFVAMLLVRNQAVTFVLLLGYAAICLFFVREKAHSIFDFLGFYTPFMVSDFIGVPNAGLLWLQRGMYFIVGLVFTFATVIMFPRLPQSMALRRFAIGFVALGALLAVGMGYSYLGYFSQGRDLRQRMNAINEEIVGKPRVTLIGSALDVTHSGDEISVKDRLTIRNDTDAAIQECYFSLNPGLVVTAVRQGGRDLTYSREAHVLQVRLSSPLAAGAMDSLQIDYHGRTDDRAIYSWVPEEKRSERYRIWMFTGAKQHSYVLSNYVLLTPAAMWYPVSGVPAGSLFPQTVVHDYIDFSLTVRSKPELTVLSQGEIVRMEKGVFHGKPDKKLPNLSLVIGRYQERAIIVDSIRYGLYTLPEHDYFVPYFSDLGDTLTQVIRELRQDYERPLKLSYPYERLNLIEAPITWVNYPLLSTVAQEFSQPEMLFLSENGLLTANANFPEQSRRMERMSERTNQVFTPEEMQTRLFRDFVRGSILETGEFGGFRENWTNMAPGSGVLPLYFSHRFYFYSERWPLLNVALESYLAKQTQEDGGRGMMFRMFRGMTDEEKANLLLTDNSLIDILKSEEDRDLAADVLKLKGEYLFKMVESDLGGDTFSDLLMRFLSDRTDRQIPGGELIETIDRQADYDFASYYDTWQSGRSLPGFKIEGVEAYKVMDRDRTRYQVRFMLLNPEPVPGLVEVNFRSGGFGGFRGFRERGPQQTGRLYKMEEQQAKEIGIVLDEQPQVLLVNTMISQNIPVELSQPLRDLQDRPRAIPFDGERIVDIPAPLREIVVDDENRGFSHSKETSTSLLKRLITTEDTSASEKYKGLIFWRPPRQWTPTTMPDFYGKYIHSAVYIRSGDGDKIATFTAQIPESGTYDIYTWIARMPMRFGRR